ncbi:hypothetical protein ALC62_04989 [Cyphomyrmex costatus]|uniref:Uncharacterized protein n=1 Tax=Cyphomyrmex costatus TaxID=456900 RepID=A0A195CU65_9HYME|nr:hypothetical protein ALC62_04989 [Cyphomyrmex costatus]
MRYAQRRERKTWRFSSSKKKVKERESSAGLAGLHKDELGNVGIVERGLEISRFILFRSLHSYESASRIHHRTLTMALFMGLSRTRNGHDGVGHGYLGTSTINVENFSVAILSLCTLFWNVSPICLPVPDFTIIADTSTKYRPKSFEDIAYLSIRCLICFETWTSTPSAGDNDR